MSFIFHVRYSARFCERAHGYLFVLFLIFYFYLPLMSEVWQSVFLSFISFQYSSSATKEEKKTSLMVRCITSGFFFLVLIFLFLTGVLAPLTSLTSNVPE